ncbi:MAG: glycosyltransferase [Chloroflexota bacterium]
MRIGLLVDVYKPFMSGVTNFVAQHKRALEVLGHEVFVFTLGHQDYRDDEPHVYRSPAIPVTETGYQFGFVYSRQARQMVETMDVLHTQHPYISGLLAVTYGQRHDIPVIFTNHTRYDQVTRLYLPGLASGLSDTLMEAYLPWFTGHCAAVTAPTQAVRRVLRDYGVTVRIPVIPNGVELEAFRNPLHRRTRAELGLPQESVVSIYVGRMAPEKNLSFLLRAFARVHQKLPRARLLLVGYGPEERDLRDLAQELGIAQAAVFAGRVSYEQVSDYLALADLFVTASVIEGQPLSIIEGLAAGLPAVAIESDAVADTLQDGYNSLLAAYNNEDLALKWATALSEQTLRARLAAGAQESSQRYDVHRTAAQMVVLYDEVVLAHRASASARGRR